MKKLFAIAMIIAMVLALPLEAYAKGLVVNKDEEEFLAEVADIMSSYYTDPDTAIQALTEIDAYLVDEPSVTTVLEEGNARGLLPTQYRVSLYCMQRGTDATTYYYMWELDTVNGAKEKTPGPLDYISIEWDTDYATYYIASADNVVSTVQSVKTGCVVFNVEDSHFDDVDYAYGSVRVTRIKSGKTRFGSQFVHTYTTWELSGSASFQWKKSTEVDEYGFMSIGLEKNYGFIVNVDSNTSEWHRWFDKWVTLG